MNEGELKAVETLAREYANRAYPVEIVHEKSDDYSGWFALVPDLPGCMTQADTLAELELMIDDAKLGWIEMALEAGLPVPEPGNRLAESGKFLVRTPKSLHRRVAEAAARDGVSLNAWVNVVLARAVGAPQHVDAAQVKEAAQVHEAAPARKRRRAKAAPAPETVAAD